MSWSQRPILYTSQLVFDELFGDQGCFFEVGGVKIIIESELLIGIIRLGAALHTLSWLLTWFYLNFNPKPCRLGLFLMFQVVIEHCVFFFFGGWSQIPKWAFSLELGGVKIIIECSVFEVSLVKYPISNLFWDWWSKNHWVFGFSHLTFCFWGRWSVWFCILFLRLWGGNFPLDNFFELGGDKCKLSFVFWSVWSQVLISCSIVR